MKHLLGFLSDAHGNGEAFDKGVALLDAHGAREFYFLGDAIGYLPSTSVLESIESLGSGIHCIQGNHEAMMLGHQYVGEKDSIYQLRDLRRSLGSRQVSDISSWPTHLRLEARGLRILLVHGSPADYTHGYVYPDSSLVSFEPDADWVFMGNTHRPFVRQQSGVNYVNVGSCGLPRDDGRYGSVCLFDGVSRRARILRYDITAETERTLQHCPTVHQSVREVFERRALSIEGDIL